MPSLYSPIEYAQQILLKILFIFIDKVDRIYREKTERNLFHPLIIPQMDTRAGAELFQGQEPRACWECPTWGQGPKNLNLSPLQLRS